jgi:ankyrin repeat protein
MGASMKTNDLLGRACRFWIFSSVVLIVALAWNSLPCQSKNHHENHSAAFNSAIYAAVKAGDLEKVKLLIKEKPQLVFSRDNVNGMTPLFMAIVQYGNRKDMACFLLANKAEVNAKTANGSTPLHAAVWRDDKEVLQLLPANGAKVNAKDNTGWTPLHWAAYHGYKEIAELLLAKRAEVNAKNNDGSTPLQAAVWQERMDIAELLRQHGGHE